MEDFPRSDLKEGVKQFGREKKLKSTRFERLKNDIFGESESDGLVNGFTNFEETKLPNVDSITVGSLLLGSVASIQHSGLVIHLINNITGFVKHSELFDTKSSINNDNKVTNFSIGSTVICSVLKVFKTHLSLTLKPSVINSNLQIQSLFPGIVLPCEVTGVEDHGFILSFHFPGQHVTGFVIFDEEKRDSIKDMMLKCYPINTIAYVAVSSVNLERKFLKCQWPWVYKKPIGLESDLAFDVLKPGLLISSIVLKVHKIKSEIGTKETFSGYTLKCLNSLKSVSSCIHANIPGLGEKVVGDEVHGRLIYVNFDRKLLFISVHPSVTRWKGPTGQSFKRLQNDIIAGQVAEKFTSGLILNSDGMNLFCPVNQLSDDGKKVNIVSSKEYELGTKHECRVLSFDYFTRLVNVSLKKSVLKERYVSPFQLKGSDFVVGKVVKMLNSGAIVQISSLVFGKVPTNHLSHNDSLNRKIKLRVLKFDYPSNRLILTSNPELLTETSPLTSFTQLSVGKQFLGYVKSSVDKVAIQFYNEIKTWLDEKQIELAKKLGIELKNDTVVKCSVVRVDEKKRRFFVTIDPNEIEKLKQDLDERVKNKRNKRKLACKEAFRDKKKVKSNNENKSL